MTAETKFTETNALLHAMNADYVQCRDTLEKMTSNEISRLMKAVENLNATAAAVILSRVLGVTKEPDLGGEKGASTDV